MQCVIIKEMRPLNLLAMLQRPKEGKDSLKIGNGGFHFDIPLW